MFVHSNGGQGWPSKPHSLRPHRIWDNHCRPCCKDSQNATSRGHRRGTAVSSSVQSYQSQRQDQDSFSIQGSYMWRSNLFQAPVDQYLSHHHMTKRRYAWKNFKVSEYISIEIQEDVCDLLCSPFPNLFVAGWALPWRHRAGLRDPCSLCPVPPHPHCHRGPHRRRGAAAALGQGALQPQSPGGQCDPDKTLH